jgi:RNA-directed DNA polymerase
MTVKDRANKGIGAVSPSAEWHSIDWNNIRLRVRKLRHRIYRATQKQAWNQVRSLMKLMLRSQANLLLAIRRVTQENQGKKTAGVDGKTYGSAKDRTALVKEMQLYSPWRVKPTKRVYIPKKDGKLRPLGIPTIVDRVAQAMVKSALEPSWEARFEANSYGFRPGRSTHDAMVHCWIYLNRRVHHKWVLDADIKGAFDNISHEFILTSTSKVPGYALIKQWLKAGYLEKETFFATDQGTPQGGIISPLLANIALNGMQQVLPAGLGYVRYADDFVITAKTRSELERSIPAIERWLAARGLVLNKEKTRLVSMKQGFNFLGFTVRHYRNGSCLITPEKAKVLNFIQSIRNWIKSNLSADPYAMIRYLNPRIFGWANYYKAFVSKRTFSYVKEQIWRQLWRWCLRRHPTKKATWVKRKYFTTLKGQDWVFFGLQPTNEGHKTIYLTQIHKVPIKRHIKVRGDASPDDPGLKEYWEKRKYAMTKGRFTQVAARRIAESQNYRCPICSGLLNSYEEDVAEGLILLGNSGKEAGVNVPTFFHKSCLGSTRRRIA